MKTFDPGPLESRSKAEKTQTRACFF